jgi:Peptidase propeptide and YPEB domain
MRTLSASIVLLAAAMMPAMADRPVTEAERAKLEAAVAAQGCSGGKMEWDDDDREFEVDDVRCNDGKKYELKFNADYTLKSKELDD